MAQGLAIAKSEPLPGAGTAPPTAALGIAKSEPLSTAAAPPPGTSSVFDRRNWPSPGGVLKRVVGSVLGGGIEDLGASTDTQKLLSGEDAGGAVGGAVGAAATLALAPRQAGVAGLSSVAKAVPFAWRAGAGLASVLGAGAGGGAVALGEGKPLFAPDRTLSDVATDAPAATDSAAQVAAWQAGLQAAGIPAGWFANAVGRRLLASKVGKDALAWLGTARATHVEQAQGVLTQAQDALDAHAAQRAAARAAEVQQGQLLTRQEAALTTTGEARTTALKGQWPQAEGPAPYLAGSAPMAPVPAHTPASTSLPPNPDRARGFTLPRPSPESARHIDAQLAARDAALGREALPGGAATPPPMRTPADDLAAKAALQEDLIAFQEELGFPFGDRDDFKAMLDTAPEDLTWGDLHSAQADLERIAKRFLPRRVPITGVGGGPLTPPPGSLFMRGARAGSSATALPPMAPVPAHTPMGTGAPTYAGRAQQAAAEVLEGPTQSAKEQLGAAVEGAAETGPALRWGPLQERLSAMLAKVQPRVLAEGGGAPALTAAESANLQTALQRGGTEADYREAIGKAGVALEEGHPLPGVLAQIASVAEDLVPFSDAHRFKRLLDDAIGWRPAGALTAPARGQLKQITKGIRGDLREMMAGHAPYDQATSAYREISKAFAPKGLARQLQAAAEVNPEALVNTLVKPSEPGKLRVLRDLLTTRAEQGGGPEGAQQGAQAWAAVQSTVLYKHLIQPGIDKWEASLAKMHPEFLQTLTAEPYAKAAFDRLATIAQAVKASEAQLAGDLAGVAGQREALAASSATQRSQAGVKATTLRRTQREAARGVQEARRSPVTRRPGEDQVGRMLTEQENAFAASSLAKPPSTAAQLSDVAYAVTAPMGSPREVAGLARIWWRGPKVNDLIHWASLSDDNTQMLVRAVSGPHAAQAVSTLIRGVQELYRQHSGLKGRQEGEPPMAVSHSQPPAPGGPLTPPPGPRR